MMMHDSKSINSTDLTGDFPPPLIPPPEGEGTGADMEARIPDSEPAQTLRVEKEALIKALVELERQEEIQTVIVLDTIQKLETLLQHLKETIHGERTLCAKHKLHQLFLPHSEWISILTDERIEAWQQEAKQFLI